MSKEGLFFGNRISIATLGVLVCNIVVGTWFASALYSRVGAIETRQQNNISSFERLIRVETNQENLKETLEDALTEMRTSINKIDANVEKLTELRRK